ncbi:Triosephosphate isomerase [Serratia symbiotica]|nr:Triosephosphate isomerase [Serratia symbiotica]
MRHPLVMGNWKLNGSTYMVSELISGISNELSRVDGCDVAIAPPVMYLDQARNTLAGSRIALSAQNVDINLLGPFTGEISANMLKDVGAKYTIIGHSERRIYHKETDEEVAKKFAVLKEAGLIPVLCIGETKAEHEEGRTEEVCAREIDSVLQNLGALAMKDAVIAYEPVWAIGTGQPASSAQVQAVHQFIRAHIAKYDMAIAAKVIIQYGGSVNDKNAAELFAQPDIDGALVGGASLKIDSFAAIVKAAAFKKSDRFQCGDKAQ